MPLLSKHLRLLQNDLCCLKHLFFYQLFLVFKVIYSILLIFLLYVIKISTSFSAFRLHSIFNILNYFKQRALAISDDVKYSLAYYDRNGVYSHRNWFLTRALTSTGTCTAYLPLKI